MQGENHPCLGYEAKIKTLERLSRRKNRLLADRNALAVLTIGLGFIHFHIGEIQEILKISKARAKNNDANTSGERQKGAPCSHRGVPSR
jgi:hypothetical protein